MITYAMTRKDEVSKLLTAFCATPQAMYFQPYHYVNLELTIEPTTWSRIQLIAVHRIGSEPKIAGYLCASINRETMSIDQISVVKFVEGHDLEFAADMASIFAFFRQHFRYIRWSVVEGSPTENFYRRVAMEHGGAEVGRFHEDYRLRDGRLADAIWFQVKGTDTPDGSTMLPLDWSR